MREKTQTAAKKRPGRKPKGAKPINIRFDAKILTRIDKAAKKAKLTRTRFLEIAAEEKLARDSEASPRYPVSCV